MLFSRIMPARLAGDAPPAPQIHAAHCTCAGCRYPRRSRNELRHFRRMKQIKEAAWIVTLSGFLIGFYLATILNLPEILVAFGWAR